MADLAKLVNLPVCAEWRSLGLQLGVPPDQLDTIQSNCAHDPNHAKQCLTNMFTWWLKSSGDPTYENLANALNSIDRSDLALKVYTSKCIIKIQVFAGRLRATLE